MNFGHHVKILFNVKSPLYYDKTARHKSLENLKNKLEDLGSVVCVKEISDKMTALRTYYTAERRKVENSKKSGTGTSDIYVSRWRRFKSLEFLNDSITPRQTESNFGDSVNSASSDCSNPPSAKVQRRILATQYETTQKLMQKALSRLD